MVVEGQQELRKKMTGALDGFRIIDVCRAGPGQMATGLLADYGADVISIVQPGHAERRTQHGAVPQGFGLVHRRNKRSMYLNLREQGSGEIFRALVKNADALMESNRPGVAKRIGADYDSIRQFNPSIMYCSLSGFGQYGPYKSLAGHDIAYQGVGGMVPIDENGHPFMPPYNQADLNAAWYGAMAILIGLLHREKKGVGQFVDVAFSDVAMTIPPGRLEDEGLRGHYPSYHIYETADGKYISLSIREPWFWERLCMFVGREEWIPHMRPTAEMRDRMFEFFRTLFREKRQAEWLKLLAEIDTQVAPVNLTLDEVLSDPHNQAREMILETMDPISGQARYEVGFGLKFSETPGELRRGPSLAGSDTNDILGDLGYAAEDIAELKLRGVIA